MIEKKTSLGLVKIGSQSELFAEAVALAKARFERRTAPEFFWALSGGSTPQAWYRWCAAQRVIPSVLALQARFTVSDERTVPVESVESNFGNAARQLLDPLGVPLAHRLPWPVELQPSQAADLYAVEISRLAGVGCAYDVCMLGLGDDAHTASLFPGSPLLGGDNGRLFAAIEVPGKGWRLTLTPSGLRACGLIVVMVTGAGKVGAIRRIFQGSEAPAAVPARILQSCADRVVWLLDEAAAAGLGE